ncbi:hypothetical protein B7453_13640 [Pseudomonas sp. IB20]|uniref:hypothetical protein n=1 Tax=Pseudomonas TaxID=286 RepID=UPI000BA0C39D|nr:MULTISPECIES: hypothetical protein [unclassified Pseudomonas]MCV2227317.1 hypothetical protein [Pseudomonas sp. AU10]OZO03917.1 hypothetical protein B7453_13640 [Pseudomonas sp. IB20]
MKVLAGIVGGLILALLVMTVFGISGAASPESGGGAGAIAFFIAWVVGLVVAITAPRAGKAWRRLLITSGVVSFMLPLAGIIFTGSHIAKNVNPNAGHSGAEAAGALIGGTLVSGFLGFVGFFLGIIFCIIGLLVGRDKQIVYVQTAPPENH